MAAPSSNESTADRIIRIILGISIGALTLNSPSQINQVIGLIISATLLITGITGFCGLYALLGISTCKNPA
jgi:hypothetical protein